MGGDPGASTEGILRPQLVVFGVILDDKGILKDFEILLITYIDCESG